MVKPDELNHQVEQIDQKKQDDRISTLSKEREKMETEEDFFKWPHFLEWVKLSTENGIYRTMSSDEGNALVELPLSHLEPLGFAHTDENEGWGYHVFQIEEDCAVGDWIKLAQDAIAEALYQDEVGGQSKMIFDGDGYEWILDMNLRRGTVHLNKEGVYVARMNHLDLRHPQKIWGECILEVGLTSAPTEEEIVKALRRGINRLDVAVQT
ncbi:MAG: hypothetical protein KIS92_03280 [Planctomycetota bacterium]|nr:hypothetical protein [Planctomycetota bacterium]